MAAGYPVLFEQQIDWFDGNGPSPLKYDASLQGYINPGDANDFRLILFRAVRVDDTATDITPVVGWDNVPEDRRRLQPNAKGTGVYAGLTPRSVGVFADGLDGDIGVYLSSPVRREEILDMRDGDPKKMWPNIKVLARHAGYMAASKLTSTERVVRGIDASYGDARGVLLTPGPTLMAKERLRRGRQAFPPGWLLWRGPEPLTRLGTVIDGEQH